MNLLKKDRNSPSTPDLLVIGGGLIGLSIAREAAEAGLGVTVLERAETGRGASWAAAGMLSPLDEAHGSGPFLDFGVESLRLYADWVRDLESESGLRVEFCACGKLVVALREPDRRSLFEKLTRAGNYGLAAEWIDADALRRREPAVTSAARGALLIHDDFRVDNRRLGKALARSCRTRGVRIETDAPVGALDLTGGRACGVTMANGNAFKAERVLIAAGAWSGTIEGLPRPLPVRPARGQMLALRPPAPVSPHVLGSRDVYLVPRDDGRLLVGATVEDVGFELANTEAGTRQLLDAARELVPSLEDVPVSEAWSGLRPETADGYPVIGPDPEVSGLFYATGHFRNGVLFAPATARAIGDLLAGGDGEGLPAEFRCERFLTVNRSAADP